MPYAENSLIHTPDDDVVVWRYLSFARLMELLENRTIWLARVDTFEDPLEGTFTDAEMQHFTNSPTLPVTAPGPEMTRQSALAATEFIRYTNFVNCWREGQFESMAMWDIYGKGEGTVAVKSTVGLLRAAVASLPQNVYLGRVEYLDWSQATLNRPMVTVCFRKDASYRHEEEVRLVVFGWEPPRIIPEILSREAIRSLPRGIELQINIERMITQFVVGPREQVRMKAPVEKILRRYGLAIPVVVSDRLTARV